MVEKREFYKSFQPLNKIWKIRDHLYLGNINTLDLLDQYYINTVFSLIPEDNLIDPKILEYHRFFICIIDDIPTENIIKCANFMLPIMFDEIKHGNNILVHCLAGISRSVSIIIAYLMIVEKLTYNQALDSIRQIRPEVNPNPGFAYQLRLCQFD